MEEKCCSLCLKFIFLGSISMNKHLQKISKAIYMGILESKLDMETITMFCELRMVHNSLPMVNKEK